jgi:hypothetical protein
MIFVFEVADLVDDDVFDKFGREVYEIEIERNTLV